MNCDSLSRFDKFFPGLLYLWVRGGRASGATFNSIKKSREIPERSKLQSKVLLRWLPSRVNVLIYNLLFALSSRVRPWDLYPNIYRILENHISVLQQRQSLLFPHWTLVAVTTLCVRLANRGAIISHRNWTRVNEDFHLRPRISHVGILVESPTSSKNWNLITAQNNWSSQSSFMTRRRLKLCNRFFVPSEVAGISLRCRTRLALSSSFTSSPRHVEAFCPRPRLSVARNSRQTNELITQYSELIWRQFTGVQCCRVKVLTTMQREKKNPKLFVKSLKNFRCSRKFQSCFDLLNVMLIVINISRKTLSDDVCVFLQLKKASRNHRDRRSLCKVSRLIVSGPLLLFANIPLGDSFLLSREFLRRLQLLISRDAARRGEAF